MIRVVLAGEGPNELGTWSREAPYREPSTPGVVEALLKRVRPDGWKVVDAVPWRSLRKLRVGKHGEAERRNIRGLVLRAWEAGAHIVAFVRDRDGNAQRGAGRGVGDRRSGSRAARDRWRRDREARIVDSVAAR